LESEAEAVADANPQSGVFEQELIEKQAELDRLTRRVPELEELVAELREELGEKASRIEKLEAVAESGPADSGLDQVVRRLTAELEQSKRESQEIRIALVKVQAEAELLRETAAELEAFRNENRRLETLQPVAGDVNLDPLRSTVDKLVLAVETSNAEIESNRNALAATVAELKVLREEIAEVVRLREENARLRSEKFGAASQEVENLKVKVETVATQLNQSQVETMVARDQLSAANHEISHMRRDMLRSAELGELS
jgi:chromosome segregation ATPase